MKKLINILSILALCITTSVFGAKPVSPGKGKGDLYADLVVLYRDWWGRPILIQKPLLPEIPGDPSPGSVFCLQPISSSPVSGYPVVVNRADGKLVSLINLGTGVPGEECDVNTNPANLALVQEVLFGRLNLGRSPSKVLAQQLRDVTDNLASSTSDIQIDEAGRFVWYDSLDVAREVDSPGNNLALFKELHLYGLPLYSSTNVAIDLPDVANPDDQTNFLDHAASSMGAAAGKGDLINLDLVVFNNRILGIPNNTEALSTINGGWVNNCPADSAPYSLGGKCQYGEIVGSVRENYINYYNAKTQGQGGQVNIYNYIRSEVFPGCVRGLLVDFPTPGATTSFEGTIMDCVFGTIANDGTCSNGIEFIANTGTQGFAQRADDARAVIAFVHDNVVADSTAILDATVAGVDQAGGTLVCDQIGL